MGSPEPQDSNRRWFPRFFFLLTPNGGDREVEIFYDMKTILFLLFLCTTSICAQNIQRLEENPTFKGITIGMSIKDDAIASKLDFARVSGEFSLYRVKEPKFFSVFNVRMNSVMVIAKDNKVYAIEATKIIKATDEKAAIFDSSELDVIQRGLTAQYGTPSCSLEENNEKYVRTGVQWESKSKLVNCFIDFYGTFVGYKLQFSMCELNIDF